MKLIINADDFGLTSGVNHGIIECYQAGSITSTTMMVNTGASAEAAKMAKENPGLGIGLHFNITLGSPVTPPEKVPTLVGKKGEFPGRAAVERNLILGKIKEEDIRREFFAQLQRFRSFQIPLTHIDSHQHVHTFPRVFDILAAFCFRENLPLRLPWVWKGSGKRISLKKRFRARILSTLVQRNESKWGACLQTNRAFASLFDLSNDPSTMSVENYIQLLTDQPSPLEIMVHPARVDEELEHLTRITHFSEKEYHLLSIINLADRVQSLGWKMVTYSEAFRN